MPVPVPIDEARALSHLTDLLAIEGLSGREKPVAEAVRAKLTRAGCKSRWMRHDRVHERIPSRAGRFESGNLIVDLPGSRRGARLLFMGHMDTVPLCRGAVPVRRGRRIVARGKTGLGGDNRTAVACLVTMIETLLGCGLAHPPITVLFTVGEEVGLWGARLVKLTDLGRPKLGFNVDGGAPAEFVIAAVGAERWQAHVNGISAHAGVHPDRGISAALIASRAITDVANRGYFGRIVKGKRRGTSNVGIISGGEATNQVTDHVLVRGESRGHDPRFVRTITETYRRAFERAAKSVRNHQKKSGSIRFEAATDYAPFRISPSAPVVERAVAGAHALGLEHELLTIDGGLDANYLNAKGVPTITFGAGQHSPHTVEEYVNIDEFLDGCRLAVALATMS
ncbi:MAG: M20/M25/M40 family metallo-hydrolase [Acidobacteriota bacterium]|nr:MAG: M20/M25/M40 family metallo-hydrolase [Acidobacteriota bacterium]